MNSDRRIEGGVGVERGGIELECVIGARTKGAVCARCRARHELHVLQDALVYSRRAALPATL